MAVESPFDILELPESGVLVTTVLSWELGQMSITPRDGRPQKIIKVIRIHVPQTTKATFPHYYDITAQTAIAQLSPILDDVVRNKRTLTLRKVGSGAAARFSIAVT
jgi:hypothetical protein